jgi:hypothetical protein
MADLASRLQCILPPTNSKAGSKMYTVSHIPIGDIGRTLTVATQVSAIVVDTTRGLNAAANSESAASFAAVNAGPFENGGSKFRSTSPDRPSGRSRVSTSPNLRYAAAPSVQKISPLKGSATAAAANLFSTLKATFTAATRIFAA